ncbi:MAG: NADH-ubiquinone oxidoreductase-F iron-sulfur binding region domain-containing protein [Planctomycetota bacterium]
MKITSLDKFEAFAAEAREKRSTAGDEILVCAGTGCVSGGSLDLKEALVKARGRKKKPVIKSTGCRGYCEKGPLVVVNPAGTFYNKVKPADAQDIVQNVAESKGPVKRLLARNLETKQRVERMEDLAFYSGQKRVALRNLGEIDPGDITEYVAVGGYASLAKILGDMEPEGIISEVEKSGLRGRGGAGFPTGRKWRTCRGVDDDPKYVICNGDEGDPGAFMDRSICEGDPHSVLEGMAICARAVGSSKGYIYVREEYPLAVQFLQKAIEDARAHGFLGKKILGTDFTFDVEISRGGGAFVCGESSALMKSVAGEVGEPRAKYVRSVVKGLFDKPTVLNNVETFANVPYIFEVGQKAFSSMGTKKSPGTKAFSVVGKVKSTGLVEVEMGTTLREIIYGVGGGIQKDRPFKAVQTGGPSGGCLPESKLDLPVDFDSLTDAGSMMGSGGMIVMDDRTCMVDVARYFLQFLMGESCGKCVPCREGVMQLFSIVESICEGRGDKGDLSRIEGLSKVIQSSSLCQLGMSAPNPVLSTLKYFRKGYETHIAKGKCPAGVCKKLTTFTVDPELCNACGACKRACPADAIEGKKKETPHEIIEAKCTRCGACRTVCPQDAINAV